MGIAAASLAGVFADNCLTHLKIYPLVDFKFKNSEQLLVYSDAVGYGTAARISKKCILRVFWRFVIYLWQRAPGSGSRE